MQAASTHLPYCEKATHHKWSLLGFMVLHHLWCVLAPRVEISCSAVLILCSSGMPYSKCIVTCMPYTLLSVPYHAQCDC